MLNTLLQNTKTIHWLEKLNNTRQRGAVKKQKHKTADHYAFFTGPTPRSNLQTSAYLILTTTKNNFSASINTLSRRLTIVQRGGNNTTFGSKRNSNSTGYMAGIRLSAAMAKKKIRQIVCCFIKGFRPTIRGLMLGLSKNSRRAFRVTRLVFKAAVPFNGSRRKSSRRI
jgi:ribosomal protein S11